jgi:hypothetical protein
MSHTITLDTYEYAKALKKANVPDAQIEVEVARDKERTKAINEVIDNNLATKHDIELVRKDIKIIEERIANIEKNQNKWGWILVFISSLTALLITFHH